MRKNYLAIKETADFLGLSEKTIYLLARSGRIPGYKFGAQWRFPYKEIVELSLRGWHEYWVRRDKDLRLRPSSLPPGRNRRELAIRKAWLAWEALKRTGSISGQVAKESTTPNPGSGKGMHE